VGDADLCPVVLVDGITCALECEAGTTAFTGHLCVPSCDSLDAGEFCKIDGGLTSASWSACGDGYVSAAIATPSIGYADQAAAVTAHKCTPCTGTTYSDTYEATCKTCPAGSEVTTADGVNTDCNTCAYGDVSTGGPACTTCDFATN
jgi:hypothetical protein